MNYLYDINSKFGNGDILAMVTVSIALKPLNLSHFVPGIKEINFMTILIIKINKLKIFISAQEMKLKFGFGLLKKIDVNTLVMKNKNLLKRAIYQYDFSSYFNLHKIFLK